ncbi:hypothetical protein T439DRAFT_303087 [Meredithblackwellia eburnea MCA 4105]
MSNIDLEKAIGSASPAFPVSWNQRDLLLYATGIGARRNELSKLYELSPEWTPFNTFPLVLGHKGDSQDLTNFDQAKERGGKTPGLPEFDNTKLVHAEQSIHILRPFPAVSGPGWSIQKSCVGVKDTGKGLIVDDAAELKGPDGQIYARMVSSTYNFGKFDVPKGFQKSIAPAQPVKASPKPPARKPDFIWSEKTTEEQAIIYRLSGDYNPLHIFPDIGKGMGFKGAILHGLCSFGHGARGIVNAVADGDGSRLTYMSARFTSPVMPGDELETTMWVSEAGPGEKKVEFIQTIKNTGKVCLGGGVAIVKNKKGGSKL